MSFFNTQDDDIGGVPMVEVVNRLTDLGIYDQHNHRPVFGWVPVLKGWLIQVNRSPNDTDVRRISINEVPWDPTVPFPWGEQSVYAEAYRKNRDRIRGRIESLL